jgi:hypothetical protein
MSQYLIFNSGDGTYRKAEADENCVVVKIDSISGGFYSLERDGDNFIYRSDGHKGKFHLKLPVEVFFDLPELTAILNMEATNLFSKVNICKSDAVKELF